MTRTAGTICVGLVIASTACGKDSGQQVPLPPGHLAFIDEQRLLAASMPDGSDYHELTTLGSVAHTPAITRNSNSIAFTYSETMTTATSLSIAVVNYPAGSVVDAICHPAGTDTFSEPSWDVEGANLFFLKNSGGTVTIQKVAVPTPLSADATSVPNPVSLGSLMVSHLAVISDTSLLVTAGSNSELYMLDTTTGTSTDVGFASMNRPAVSPDGSQFVYFKSGTGLVLYTILTKASTSLDLAGANSDQNPWFAPTSSYVSFDNGVDIFAVPTAGGGTRFPLYAHTPGTQASWGS